MILGCTRDNILVRHSHIFLGYCNPHPVDIPLRDTEPEDCLEDQQDTGSGPCGTWPCRWLCHHMRSADRDPRIPLCDRSYPMDNQHLGGIHLKQEYLLGKCTSRIYFFAYIGSTLHGHFQPNQSGKCKLHDGWKRCRLHLPHRGCYGRGQHTGDQHKPCCQDNLHHVGIHLS